MITHFASGTGQRLAAARAGSPEALGQTLEGCRRYLLWIARRELDPTIQAKGGASDIVQETFLDAHRSFENFHGDSEEELLAWLRRLLLNNLSNFIRRYKETAKRRLADEVSLDSSRYFGEGPLEFPAESATPGEEVLQREQRALLQQALRQLPEEERQIIALWQYEGKSFQEIGRLLGRSGGTVRARWIKAIKRIQAYLEALA